MAPEQAEGKPVDHRTDIYALGLLLYEVFTGVAAFSGETMVTVVMKQIMEAPRPPRQLQPALPANLERAILGCLEKNPDRRFASVSELEAALTSGDGAPLAAHLVPAVLPPITTEIAAPPQVLPPQVATPPKQKWWKTAIGITAMGCVVPTFLFCLMIVAIVYRGKDKKVPAVQISPDGNVTVAPTEPPAPAKKPSAQTPNKDKKTKPAPDTDEDDETSAPAPPTTNIPGFNIPIIPPGVLGKDGANVKELVKNAIEMKVQVLVQQGDKYMEQKKYRSAVEVYKLAAADRPDDETIKNKLLVAREALAAQQ
jgi:hypothetical protein